MRTFLILLFLAALIGAAGTAYWWLGRVPTSQLSGALEQAGDATVGQGQAEAANDAQRITTTGQDRDRRSAQTHEANHAAILSAPGADVPINPRLLRVHRAGLCQYDAYRDDPVCAQLR